MKEILFKGKRIDNGDWVDGCYMTDEQDPTTAYIGHIFGMDGGILVHDMDIVQVDPQTVCQYTGLTDREGRKIFDGDIISFDYELGSWGRTATVLFEDGEYRYRAITNAADLYNCRICGENDRCEVIGNIFDNPELIGDQP